MATSFEANQDFLVESLLIPYKVRFPPEGIRMPKNLIVGSDNLLAATTDCGAENGLGLLVSPTYQISTPDLNPTKATSGLDVQLEGAIVRVVVDWALDFTCGIPQQASGFSVFTMYPTGKIVRHDEITPTTTRLEPNDDCGCNGRGPVTRWNVESFYTFHAGTDVTRGGTPLASGNNVTEGCTLFADPTSAVGVTWPTDTTRLLDQAVDRISWIHDFALDQPAVETTTQTLTSAIQLSTGTDCGEILAQLVTPPLRIAGVETTTDDFGFYRDDARHEDPFDITADAPIPAGFVVALDMEPFAEISSTPAMQIIPQVDRDRRVVLWFSDPLPVGGVVHIEPQ